MPSYTTATSNDGRAILGYRSGILKDTISLWVDNVLVAEKFYYGTNWPAETEISLQGGGFLVDVQIGWKSKGMGVSQLKSCSFKCTSSTDSSRTSSTTQTDQSRSAATAFGDDGAHNSSRADSDREKANGAHRAKSANGNVASDSEFDEFTSVTEALQELGISGSIVDLARIQDAYKILVKRYHPDVYEAMNLPPEMVRAAKIKFIRVQSAYTYLRSSVRS